MRTDFITERPMAGVSARSSAVTALAVVGFLTLVFVGILLAIYAARYVPQIVTTLTGGSQTGSAELTVVPSLPFSEATSTVATSTQAAATTTSATPATAVASETATPSNQVVGYETLATTYPRPGATKIAVPSGGTTDAGYGLPNLTVAITAVGYLDDNGNFVADKSISYDQSLAVRFRVTNTGTNDSGRWSLTATLPTKSDSTYDYDSGTLDSLKPGAYVDYTLHLDERQAHKGDDEEITITVDSDDDVDESNERDNKDSATITVND